MGCNVCPHTTSCRCSGGFGFRWLWRLEKYWTHCQLQPVWDECYFATRHIIMLDVSFRRILSAGILTWALAFKLWLVGSKGPKVCHYHTTSLVYWHKVGLLMANSNFTICVSVEIKIHQTQLHFPLFSCLVLVSLCLLQPQTSILG